MAKVTILYWQDIPSVVEARDRGGRHKVELSQRFQELIDLIAMKKKVMGTDEYLNHWSKDRRRSTKGTRKQWPQRSPAGSRRDTRRSRREEIAKCYP